MNKYEQANKEAVARQDSQALAKWMHEAVERGQAIPCHTQTPAEWGQQQVNEMRQRGIV